MKRILVSLAVLGVMTMPVWAQPRPEFPKSFSYPSIMNAPLTVEYAKAKSALRNHVLNRSLAGLANGAEQKDYEKKALDGASASSDLASAYVNGVKSPGFSRSVLSDLLSSYAVGTEKAESAPQATQINTEITAEAALLQSAQNARLIEQNDLVISQNAQIIALLKQLVSKK
jgi:hypothetical protein